MKLTELMIKKAKPRSIIADGYTSDDINGVNMNNTGVALCFVIYRGDIPDWCVYIGLATSSKEDITRSGDKVRQRHSLDNILEFGDEVWEMYRH